MKTLVSLLRMSRLPRGRVAASVGLGTLAVLAGVGLLSYAGYLISRAAERPPILSLGVVIVAVRFFGLARPLARYFERLTSHDLAFRLLARLRVAFFARLEPLVPSRLEGYRRGDLLARMVGDVEALQNLFLRGVTPPLVALLAGAVSVAVCAAYLPAAGAVLAAGLLTGGVAVPALAATAGRRFGARQANARAELTEVLRPSVAYVLSSMMRSVVEEGTATRALVLDRPLAGKTGTSNESRDVWFGGFSAELVAVVWVGFDDNASLGRATGGSTALPIWIRFMGRALEGVPRRDFRPPDDVVFVKVDVGGCV